jgi:hypothetical protein
MVGMFMDGVNGGGVGDEVKVSVICECRIGKEDKCELCKYYEVYFALPVLTPIVTVVPNSSFKYLSSFASEG